MMAEDLMKLKLLQLSSSFRGARTALAEYLIRLIRPVEFTYAEPSTGASGCF
jgi:hypothetical protein